MIMKSYKKYFKKTAAEIMIATMMTVNISVSALADTTTPIVEISDYGPVGSSTTTDSTAVVSSGEGLVEAPNSSSVSAVVTVTDTTSSTSTAETSAAETIASSVQETTAAETTVAAEETTAAAVQETSAAETAASTVNTNYFQSTGGTTSFLKTSLTASPEVNANFAILVDADSNLVVAEKNSEAKMYPASMTKVMTLLVACEHITNLTDEVEITSDIIDYVNDNGASNCGFKAGEKVTVQDLLYGLILPSGADAALALVRYIAGSEEQFVNLMNQKAQELGISATTHYTNTTGLYNDNHYTTAKDMALVMKYAAANPYASAVLSTRSYTTQPNNKHSSGVSFSNLFLKRIDTQSTGGNALMAKTGYVSKAGNCAVSYFTGASGKHYICVTGKTSGAWNVVYAHAALYKSYGK